jgi:hypothetical protein
LDTKIWNQITCPECSAHLIYDDIQRLADPETFSRYEVMSFRSAVGSDSNFIWCQQSGCDFGQLHDDENGQRPIVRCLKCGFRSCVRHGVKWHERLTCEEYDAMLADPENFESMVDKEDKEAKEKLRRMEEEDERLAREMEGEERVAEEERQRRRHEEERRRERERQEREAERKKVEKYVFSFFLFMVNLLFMGEPSRGSAEGHSSHLSLVTTLSPSQNSLYNANKTTENARKKRKSSSADNAKKNNPSQKSKARRNNVPGASGRSRRMMGVRI